jgi:hypothetical protein
MNGVAKSVTRHGMPNARPYLTASGSSSKACSTGRMLRPLPSEGNGIGEDIVQNLAVALGGPRPVKTFLERLSSVPAYLADVGVPHPQDAPGQGPGIVGLDTDPAPVLLGDEGGFGAGTMSSTSQARSSWPRAAASNRANSPSGSTRCWDPRQPLAPPPRETNGFFSGNPLPLYVATRSKTSPIRATMFGQW